MKNLGKETWTGGCVAKNESCLTVGLNGVGTCRLTKCFGVSSERVQEFVRRLHLYMLVE